MSVIISLLLLAILCAISPTALSVVLGALGLVLGVCIIWALGAFLWKICIGLFVCLVMLKQWILGEKGS